MEDFFSVMHDVESFSCDAVIFDGELHDEEYDEEEDDDDW